MQVNIEVQSENTKSSSFGQMVQSVLMNIISLVLLNAKARETQPKQESYGKKQSDKLKV